jgi:hypothetical protein
MTCHTKTMPVNFLATDGNWQKLEKKIVKGLRIRVTMSYSRWNADAGCEIRALILIDAKTGTKVKATLTQYNLVLSRKYAGLVRQETARYEIMSYEQCMPGQLSYSCYTS